MIESDRLFEFVGKSVEDGRPLGTLDEEMDKRFGETCATLVLDSTGFTRTTKAMGMAYFLSIIYRMRRVCEKICTEKAAIETRAHADNFYAEFKSVDDAVAAAFAVHQYFEDHPIALVREDDWYGVCIGIGYGRVWRSDHDGVYGNEMNYASKLGEDIAERGDTLLTEAAFGSLSDPESVLVSESCFSVSGVELPVYNLRPAADPS